MNSFYNAKILMKNNTKTTQTSKSIKTFAAQFTQTPNGQFKLIEGTVSQLKKINQHRADWVTVPAQPLAIEMKTRGFA